MATFVIPFSANGKTRLGDRQLARAMLADVQEAAKDALIVDRPGGQGRRSPRPSPRSAAR